MHGKYVILCNEKGGILNDPVLLRLDEGGNLVEGRHFDGVWRWTKGHLEMTVRDDRSYSINWRELAIDPPPKIWSRYARDVGGW